MQRRKFNGLAALPILILLLNTLSCTSARKAEQSSVEPVAAAPLTAAKIAWVDWDDQIFAHAKQEKKLVLLDLKAVWCHWCHVMDKKTYSDERVAALLNQKFLSAHVDQDSRPDLAARYEDYGWPATIIYNSDGKEIVKRSGYIAPDQMLELLRRVSKDPTPMSDEPVSQSQALTSQLSPKQKKSLEAEVLVRYDQKQGSWDVSHKFMDAGFADLFLARSLRGDKRAAKWLQQTLDQNLKIHDQVWGGVYQYSTGRVWNEPHFEKIMSNQAENLRVYAQASLVFNSPRYLEASRRIAKYVENFLTSPEGAFYTSQDADLIPGLHSDGYFKLGDEDRRKQGVPRVDQHVYSRENGWMIAALTSLYAATGERVYFDRAERAAKWILENRTLGDGGFRHDVKDNAGPYLGDTVSMGNAFLRLYLVSGNRSYFELAVRAAIFLNQQFRERQAGFIPAASSSFPLGPIADENLQVARFANLLFRYSADPTHEKLVQHALKFLTIPDVADGIYVTASLLQIVSEVEASPVHVTLLASKADKSAKVLWTEALKFPLFYQRVDWWDRSEGALPSNDVTYPELSRSAVFTCTANRCSLPAFEVADVKKRIRSLGSP